MSDKKTNFDALISVAQTLLLTSSEISPSAAIIREKTIIAARVFGANSFTEDAIESAIAELIRRYSVWIGRTSTLADNSDHRKWLSTDRKNGWRYWERYRDSIERKLPPAAAEGLNVSTDEVIGLLEDPLRPGPWDRRGLVVGHVQSGKTSHYTGLICKAADAGYKLIIVLAGLHNNLRAQTQIRLEEGFLGYETSASNSFVKHLGVGEKGRDHDIRPNCATNRTESGDFSTRVANHLAITPEERPWLFVVKKNKVVLDRLLKWIENHVADSIDTTGRHSMVTNLPLLLIDDEADNASVDTGEQLFDAEGSPDLDHEPKAINSRIRKILNKFHKSAYVGYTATPFANVFIHRKGETSDEGPDIFPKSFIINLSAPSNYVGPSKLFSLDSYAEADDDFPLIRPFDDHATDDRNGGWMPEKHSKTHVPVNDGVDELPESLRAAINSFIISCAVRQQRGQSKEHSSMLIHVTRYVQVQREVQRQVNAYVRSIRQRLSLKIDNQSTLNSFRQLWNSDFVPTSARVNRGLTENDESPPLPSWDVIESLLSGVVGDIEVRMINGKAKDVLDYSAASEQGLRVIAVGGDKLARGLTLEGLCVSYFVRTTKMYDTLMQMGRWFGYRPQYLDLCRLYTTAELIEWFKHITAASEELREEFDAMRDSGATPNDYGLRVQSHPVLLVTSPLKMRSAHDLKISFSGDILETVSLHKSETVLDKNLKTTNRLISRCGEITPPSVVTNKNNSNKVRGFLWQQIPPQLIIDFFELYETHPGARKVNSLLIREFISSMNKINQLTSWTVFLVGNTTGTPYTFESGITVPGLITRDADLSLPDRYAFGRLVSPRDEAVDLDAAALEAALQRTLKVWNPDPGRLAAGQKPAAPTFPSGIAIRHIRGMGDPLHGVAAAPERGLLLLYPLNPKESGLSELSSRSDPLIAWGVSFPASDAGVKVSYAVDHLTWASEYGQAD